MALTQRHMDLQALDVFSTVSGTNLGFSMYFFSFLRVESGMFSCRGGGMDGLGTASPGTELHSSD